MAAGTHETAAAAPRPLEGVRVVDLSRFIAGPLCAQILADMGAEVIKVERPGGEDARHHAPFVAGESLYTMMYNRNKRAVTLDTRDPRAKGVLNALLTDADVLVENYRPGTLAAMGLPHHELRSTFPRLVVTSISGFGQTGPLAERALFDAIAQAASGLMSLTGRPSDPPVLTGTYISDYVTAYYAALGTMFALFHRERTGDGQVVDISSLDAMVSLLGTRPSAYLMMGEIPVRTGSRDLLTAPANTFLCEDGHVYLHGGTDSLFRKLCVAMDRKDLAEDERFATIEGRMAHVELLEGEVEAWTLARTRDAVCGALSAAGVPCGAVATVQEVVRSPQIEARNMMVEMEHPVAGTVVLPGSPIKLSETPVRYELAPPVVGADNEHVYSGLLGFAAAEVEEWRRTGLI